MNKIIKEKMKLNKKALVLWAAKCAEHVLPYFEEKYPKDNRPRKAIETARAWAKKKINLNEIRYVALRAHAAARKVKNPLAVAAARSAGQAVATAHAAGHSIAAANYALKAVGTENSSKEREWQYKQLPKHLRIIQGFDNILEYQKNNGAQHTKVCGL